MIFFVGKEGEREESRKFTKKIERRVFHLFFPLLWLGTCSTAALQRRARLIKKRKDF